LGRDGIGQPLSKGSETVGTGLSKQTAKHNEETSATRTSTKEGNKGEEGNVLKAKNGMRERRKTCQEDKGGEERGETRGGGRELGVPRPGLPKQPIQNARQRGEGGKRTLNTR